MFAAIDARQFASLPQFYTPDCCWVQPGCMPIRGIIDLNLFYRFQRKSGGRHRELATIVQGDRAVTTGRFEAVSQEDGTVSPPIEFSDHFRFAADGRIAERKTYFFAVGQ